jgi:Spy/CpxP family protein refolding chaperone
MKATVLALALACSGVAFAADTSTTTPPNAAAREAQHMANLATLLDLTDTQKAQVQPILQAEHEKMKAAFEQAKASGTKPDFAQMKALHQQIQTETLQKLQPVLSALQLKKFQVLSQMHGHGHFRHGPPGSRPPAAPATAAPSSG